MFNAWGEGYLCLLKRFLFLPIRRLYSFSFYVKYKNKKGHKNFLAAFFGARILFKQYQNIYPLEFHIYRQIPLHTHDYLKIQFENIRVATDEGPSPKLALSEGGSR